MSMEFDYSCIYNLTRNCKARKLVAGDFGKKKNPVVEPYIDDFKLTDEQRTFGKLAKTLLPMMASIMPESVILSQYCERCPKLMKARAKNIQLHYPYPQVHEAKASTPPPPPPNERERNPLEDSA